ncbi:hypothetical protein G9A89_009788 [Geosiphon pyriformis]|nr:hypothetical protein G9A89_009788 [Geosiphon pyriformis]
MDDNEVVLSSQLPISLKKKWIDLKIVKTSVEVSIRKSFALDINLSAVEGKSATAKTQLIRKIFSTVNGFEGVTTSSKFEEIIQSTFTSEESLIKTTSLAREKKAVVEFAKLEQAKQLASRWSFLIEKDSCEKYGKFEHSALKCDAFDTLVSVLSKKTYKKTASEEVYVQLARLYAKKNVPIFCPAAFGSKSWAQIVSSASSSGGLLFESGFGSGSFSSGASDMGGGSPFALTNNLSLNACLSSLECSLELLGDQVSGILHKLDSIDLVPLVSPSSSNSPVTLINVKLDLNSDMVLESSVVVSVHSPVVSALEPSSSKILITKKFNGVRIFTSGLKESFLGVGVAVIMNEYLVWHVSKVEEIPGQVISIRLLFKGKISISIMGLYASAFIESRFNQASTINFLIAKAVNSSTFVVLDGNFNKNGKRKSANVNCNLSFTVTGHKVGSIVEFFNTNHQAVSVLIGLRGLVDSNLNSLCKQANRNKWKFKIKDADADLGNLDTMWDILREAVVMSADKIFSKCWFSDFECIRNKYFSKFFRLELLVAKIVKSLSLDCTVDFVCFLHTWYGLDETEASEFEALINNNVGTEMALWHLAGVRKKYCKSKYYEFRMARDNSIRKAINKHIENFSSDKRRMIQNVLDQPVRKVVLNHLIVDDNLILDPCNVKSNIDTIMEGWTKKHMVPKVLPDCWSAQYALLVHVDSSVFANVMSNFNLDELWVVVSNLPDGKAAGFSGITN